MMLSYPTKEECLIELSHDIFKLKSHEELAWMYAEYVLKVMHTTEDEDGFKLYATSKLF